MSTVIAYAILAAVLVADIAVSYTIGKAVGHFISWTMEAIRKAFRR